MPEVDELIDAITTRLRAVVATLDSLDPANLNAMPTIEGTNSPYVLGAHTLGNARAWILGIALEQDITRDRPAEFASTGPDAAQLQALLMEIESGMKAGFSGKTSAGLDRRLSPRQDLWGPNPVREISVRQALLQVLHHASLHLGHLELTRDIVGKR
jgi:hypothetical protein